MNKKITIIILMILLIMSITPSAFAAVSVKPSNSSYLLSPSDAYAACMNMKNGATSTLGNNNLDPHLMLNSDWAAMAYLGLSEYGGITSACGANNNATFTGNGEATVQIRTATGNQTGVETGYVANQDDYYRIYTSSMLSGTSTSTAWKNLYDNQNTKYVEVLPTDFNDTVGQAIIETNGWHGGSTAYVNSSNPIMSRTKAVTGYNRSQGQASYTSYIYATNFAFRPVIWNK